MRVHLVLFVLSASAAATEYTPGVLFLAEPGADRLLRLDGSFAPDGSIGSAAQLDEPVDLAFAPDGHLYVASRGTDRVVEFDGDGQVVVQLGAAAGLDAPGGVCIGPGGRLYVTSETQDRVLVLARTGELLHAFGADQGLDQPRGIRIGPDGHVFVASAASDRVLEFDPGGGFVRALGAGAGIDQPERLAFAADGRLFVTCAGNDAVAVFDTDGTALASLGAGSGLSDPAGIAFGADGLLYVADGAGTLHAFDGAGVQAASFSGLGTAFAAIAFAPWRFQVTISGKLGADGAKDLKPGKKAELALHPGSGCAALALPAGDLAVALGSDRLTWWGREAFENALSKKRLLHAMQVPDAAAERGVASLLLQIQGKTGGGAFVPKSFSGTLHLSGSGLAGSLDIESKKKLD